MTTARRLNLTAALCVVALCDLVLHRLIERLFLSQHPTGLARVLAEAGRFAFHLGGVLGLALVMATLFASLRRTDLFPRSMRFAVASIGLFFVVTAGMAVLALDRPDLWPGRNRTHDLWHVFVLGGSACHFVLMLCFVAPAI